MRNRAALFAVLVVTTSLAACNPFDESWTSEEKARITSLGLHRLAPLPPDPSNKIADNPKAAALGGKLFFDTALSINGKVACASCHQPENGFQDSLPLAVAVGTNNRRTMPLEGTARIPWLFWDGRKDSQWSQALGPLENPVEHGTDRTSVVRHVLTEYALPYRELFGPLPPLDSWPTAASPVVEGLPKINWEALSDAERRDINTAFANIGKVIAAFERTLEPHRTRFDYYAKALETGEKPTGDAAFSRGEMAGLKLFIGKGQGINCHNGPLLSDGHFHNTGVAVVAGLPEDKGRAAAIQQVQTDPFNCLGPFSDAKPEACQELRFIKATGHELLRAFKPPSLRGVATRAPYMHAGQIRSLTDVVAHYNSAPLSPFGHSELKPLHLTPDEQEELVVFLKTLN